MYTRSRRRVLAASLGVFCSFACVAQEGGLPLGEVCAIVVAEAATPQERTAAAYLRAELAQRFGTKADIRDKTGCQPAIRIGAAALRDGFVEPVELAGIGADGFVIRNSGTQIVVAGGGPAGTVFGIYELMRRMGFRFYPWEFGNGIVVFRPLPGGRLPVLNERQQPFFRHRDIGSGGDGPRYGVTIREFSLADLKFANADPEFKSGGWINWDHTAGWLVPMTRYGDRNGLFPERNAGEMGAIPTHKVGVCMCHPDAAPTATGRMLEWIGRQPERHYFAVADGDVARPRCPACETLDPLPDYYTDRLLSWVNAVATTAGARHPDKTFFTLAYLGTVKPPATAALARNAIVVYAPWYWNSRSSSAVGLEHAVNMIAAEEFTDWTRQFPGQIGIYDYPGTNVFGTATRIREYARRDVRWIYFNGWKGDLLRWVAARLTWDPTVTTDSLVDEFVGPYYGPAAPVMRAWLALLESTVSRSGASVHEFFLDDAFLVGTWSLTRQAEAIAARADAPTRSRIRAGLVEPYEVLLRGLGAGRGAGVTLREVAAGYARLQAALRQDLVAIGASESLLRRHDNELRATLTAFGVKADADDPISQLLDAVSEALTQSATPGSAEIPGPRRVAFEGSREAKRWRVASSDSREMMPRAARERGPLRAVSGTAFDAPLPSLPVGRRGMRTAHLGNVFAERILDRPLRVAAADSAYLHVVASADVPASVYLRVAGQGLLRADVALHEGEQIVRVDLANFRGLAGEGSLTGLGVELWPQDLIYPYPPARDVELVLASLELRAGEPDPAWLPYAGRAAWLTSFRPNVSHGDGAIIRATRSDRATAAMHQRYGSSRSETFRSFTAHRVLTPVAGIVAGPESEQAATALQAGIAAQFAVQLPRIEFADASSKAKGNLIWLGAASGAAGVMAADHVASLPTGSFAIRAAHGRVAIGGTDVLATADGVERYLRSHGRITQEPATGPGALTLPSAAFLTELHADDEPYFTTGFPSCSAASPQASVKQPSAMARVSSAQTAFLIGAARNGDRALPPELVEAAGISPGHCREVRRMARNPFAGWSM
jgi:hypothetical protein